MGPPQLGDVHAPRSSAPDPAAELCRKCGQPWDAHQRVRTSSRGYATCPPAPAGSAGSSPDAAATSDGVGAAEDERLR